MTPKEARKLNVGLYDITWRNGGTCLAAIGCDSEGLRWYAPVTWSRVPSCDWWLVDSVRYINPYPKSEKEAEPVEPVEPPNQWDWISEKTGVDRHVCKVILLGLLFGMDVLKAITRHGLHLDEVVDLRLAFDDYVQKYKEKS